MKQRVRCILFGHEFYYNPVGDNYCRHCGLSKNEVFE